MQGASSVAVSDHITEIHCSFSNRIRHSLFMDIRLCYLSCWQINNFECFAKKNICLFNSA